MVSSKGTKNLNGTMHSQAIEILELKRLSHDRICCSIDEPNSKKYCVQ